jgi:RHS repeat-associated protein
MYLGYDVFDRVVSTYLSGASTAAGYDAFGRRIWRQMADGSQKVFFYDFGGRLLAEYTNPASGEGPSRIMEYFAGQRIGEYTDRSGSVRYSAAGPGTWRHYYPYGEEVASTSNDTYKFGQLYRDGDTGLDNAVHRCYAAGLGRFLTADPLRQAAAQPANPATWNLYAYSLNDPINLVDPAGLAPILFT